MRNACLITFLFAMMCLFSMTSSAQEVKELNFEQLERKYMAKQEDDTLYVLNFWATWCRPCVAELPAFEAAHESFKDKQVKVVLVSLDFADMVDIQLKPFISKRGLQPEVVLLNAPNENEWIPKVSQEWSGAIPATLMVQPSSGFRAFYEQSFDKEELTNEINKNLKACQE